jgi:hypothetical protein
MLKHALAITENWNRTQTSSAQVDLDIIDPPGASLLASTHGVSLLRTTYCNAKANRHSKALKDLLKDIEVAI